jgi:hypothetical protein
MELQREDMKKGLILLGFFRDNQEKRGHNGCYCSQCVEDMAKAYVEMKENK